jgi:hypothetical protein
LAIGAHAAAGDSLLNDCVVVNGGTCTTKHPFRVPL